MATIILPTLDDTCGFGRFLAENLEKYGLPAIFMRGDIGVGKTTLVKSIVDKLPGSENAEISSPSFNLYNIYPTTPQVMHCDLYRCQTDFPNEIVEALDEKKSLVLVEWSEYFPLQNFSGEYLDISFKITHDSRLLEILANGSNAQKLLDKIRDWQ